VQHSFDKKTGPRVHLKQLY